jgi:hypothetical protein
MMSARSNNENKIGIQHTQYAVAMFSSICRACCRVISLPLRTASKATLRLVGLLSSMAVIVSEAHDRIDSSSCSCEIFFSSSKIFSTRLCPKALSRATRFAPTIEHGRSLGSRSCDASSIVASITSFTGLSNEASRSSSDDIRREGT